MRPKAAARYALFLILLVLGQEFSVARYSDAPVNHGEPLRGDQFSFPNARKGLFDEDGEDFRSEQIYREFDSPDYIKPKPDDLDSDYRELTEDDFKIFGPREVVKDNSDEEERLDDLRYFENLRKLNPQSFKEFTDVKEEDKEEKKVEFDEDDNEEDESTELATKEDSELNIQKRGWFTVIVLGVTLGLTVADLGVEIYFKIHGCCKDWPKACEYANTFKTQKALMKTLNTNIDDRVLLAKNFLTDIKLTNGEISTVMQKVMHIMSLEEELIFALHPSVIKDFEAKWAQIKRELRKKNQTVMAWTNAEMNLQFRSVFDSVEGTLLAMGGIFATLLEGGVILAWNQWQKNKAAKKLKLAESPKSPIHKETSLMRRTSSMRTRSLSNVDVDVKLQRSKSMDADVSTGKKPGKMAARLQTTAKLLTGLVVIAGAVLTVYSIMKKFEQCRDIVAAAKKGAEGITAANRNLTRLKNQIGAYDQYLDKNGASYLLRQLRDPKFLKTLTKIRDLLYGAGKRSNNNRLAAVAVETYLRDIPSASFNRTYNMVKALIKGLGRVEYLYKCYISKVKLKNYIVSHCKDGNYNLKTLFDQASKSWNTTEKGCISKSGIPYYTYNDAHIAVVKGFNNSNFSSDCILNSASKRREACRYVIKDKMTHAQAGKAMSDPKKNLIITAAQVKIMTKNCPPFLLTKANIDTICNLRKAGLTDKLIKKYSLHWIKLETIKAVKCPKKAG